MSGRFDLNDLPPRMVAKIRLVGACWEWTGANSRGYGVIRRGGKNLYAHRIAYQTLVGTIPNGLELDHLKALGCIGRACCYPGHLEPVTGRTNVLRGETITAANAAKTHCPKGHLYDMTWRNRRMCRTCRREQGRASWARRKGARRAELRP